MIEPKEGKIHRSGVLYVCLMTLLLIYYAGARKGIPVALISFVFILVTNEGGLRSYINSENVRWYEFCGILLVLFLFTIFIVKFA